MDPRLRRWFGDYLHEAAARYRDDLELVRQYHPGGPLLEVGAMPCHFTFCLQRLGMPVVAVDLAPERLAGFIHRHGLTVLPCDIEREPLPLHGERFDLILFNEVFEHLRLDPLLALRHLRQTLAPRGILILTTPNLYSLRTTLSFLAGRGFNNPLVEWQKEQWLGHAGHVREYSTREMRRLLEASGFTVRRVTYRSRRPTPWRKGGRLLDAGRALVPRWRESQVVIAEGS